MADVSGYNSWGYAREWPTVLLVAHLFNLSLYDLLAAHFIPSFHVMIFYVLQGSVIFLCKFVPGYVSLWHKRSIFPGSFDMFLGLKPKLILW